MEKMDNLDKLDFSKIDFDNLTPEEIDQMNEYIGECTGNCDGCGADCHQVTPKISVYCAAIAGAKGGIGKSVITALLASALRRRGLTVGIIDSDIAMPAIPHLFGQSGTMPNDGKRISPLDMGNGVKAVSMGLLGSDNNEPCLLGGKESSNIAAYFWSGTDWQMPDCVLIDMPSGIGDIPLELLTVLPIDQMIVVTTPGELSAAMIRKSVRLFKMLLLPIRGVIENMSIGDNNSISLLEDDKLNLLAKIPYDPDLAMAADEGKLGNYICEPIESVAEQMAADIKKMKK